MMPCLIMERTFDPPLTEEDLQQMTAGLAPCLRQFSVRWQHSYLSKDRTRLICAFAAADADTVRFAFRTAGVKPGTVWPAEVLSRQATPA